MARSPKGLIENRSVTPEEAEQLGTPWPDFRQAIKNLMGSWKQFAESHIEANPATDGTLDRTAAAVALLDKLQAIEHYLAAAERNGASGDLYLAVYHALLLASLVHQLAIIDNETPIIARQKSIKGASRGGTGRSASKRMRNHEMAGEFLKRRGRGKSDTALKEAIGAARGLKRRASVDAVNSGLKDLNRD
jgi:hypothetical protein